MAFTREISEQDITTHGMVACADTLTGTATENKQRFDELVREVVKVEFNGLVDELEDESAAGNLGFDPPTGMEAENVQDAIEEIYTDTTEGVAKATAEALKSEGYAVGKQNGTEVTSESDYYHNNAKYYSEQASDSADAAAGSASTATTKASEASSSATAASGSASDASTYKSQAETAKTAAQAAQTAAEAAQTSAETAESAAETAQTAAETAQSAAESARDSAISAKNDAVTAKTAAETAEANAESWAAQVHYPVSYGESQSLTDAQKSQARTNVGAAKKASSFTSGNLLKFGSDGECENTDLSASMISGMIAAAHNSLFRFKDITSYFTDGTLWNRITGTGYDHPFYDIYAGDYFDMGRAVTCPDSYDSTQGSRWVTVAGCNSLYGIGDTGLTRNHLVMVPGKGLEGDQHFGRHRMNSTNTTTGGYQGSEMFSSVLGSVVSSGATSGTINQQLKYIFGDHLITTRELSSNAMTSTLYNKFGSAGGASSSWGWHDAQACLMSEVEVYGATVWSSSGYDTGTGKNQFPLFAHFTQAMNNRSAYYWLKDVASASYFCLCLLSGYANYTNASNANAYVRPRFVIG